MISEIDDFWKPATDSVKPGSLDIDYENLNGIAIYVALKANLPILIVDIIFIENFVSQAVLSTNRAYQMTVLHSAMNFIEETLPSYYEQKDNTKPLNGQQFTPKFNAVIGLTSSVVSSNNGGMNSSFTKDNQRVTSLRQNQPSSSEQRVEASEED